MATLAALGLGFLSQVINLVEVGLMVPKHRSRSVGPLIHYKHYTHSRFACMFGREYLTLLHALGSFLVICSLSVTAL